MNASVITRRHFGLGALTSLGLGVTRSGAQGFAGLSDSAQGFAHVMPGKVFSFPADHGPHPDFRIEWWYVTANLSGPDGIAYGMQWTLFRQAMAPGGEREGWANQQVWMAHAAVTGAEFHRTSQTFARGGIGQAGVETQPFRAWIDSWQMRGLDGMNAQTVAPLELTASARDFSYALHLDASTPLVLQGDGGYIRKSNGEQATYYYSQPFFTVRGRIGVDDKPVDVTGQAWLDREWSSQLLAPDQTGWDWFALHFKSGEKLMLYRLRQRDGSPYLSGNWISPDGRGRQIAPSDIELTPRGSVEIERHTLPVRWHLAIPSLALAIDCVPLNPRAWMGTSIPYWEGPISFHGSHEGVGYLELTGY